MDTLDTMDREDIEHPMLDLKGGSSFGLILAMQSTVSISTEVQLTEPPEKPAVPGFPQRRPAVMYSLISSLKESSCRNHRGVPVERASSWSTVSQGRSEVVVFSRRWRQNSSLWSSEVPVSG